MMMLLVVEPRDYILKWFTTSNIVLEMRLLRTGTVLEKMNLEQDSLPS